MKVCARQFNLYLALMAGFILLCGCQTQKQDKEPVSALRIHLESTAGLPGTTQDITVLRADPVAVTIATEPILTEANILTAKVIESEGGFAIEIRFDESSALMLEQYSASYPGKHFVIFGQWGETTNDGRWLAAPLITHRIADGILSFTPDMSRTEADRFVLGLNNVSKNNHANPPK